MRVCEAPERAAVQALFGKPRLKLRLTLQEVVDAARLGRRTRHIADEMNDDVAVCHVLFEHGERVAAERLEVLLDLDLDIRSRQRAAELVAIVAELIGHAGEKELDVRHSPPALWPWVQCGMAGQVRKAVLFARDQHPPRDAAGRGRSPFLSALLRARNCLAKIRMLC